MKFFTLSLLLSPLFLFSQNWLPVVAGETYHYRLTNAPQITHTIRVDSVKSTPEGIAHYLNRVFIHFPDQNEFILIRRGQFLGQVMVLRPDGSVVLRESSFMLFRETILFPQAGFGATWMAIPAQNVTATVISVGEAAILGEVDSVKVIAFSNGTAWALSKNHGVMFATDYQLGDAAVELTGLESKGLGDRLYRFEDFYSFNVGDVFEWVSSHTSFVVEQGSRQKIAILEKNTLPNGAGFSYRVRRGIRTVVGATVDTVWLTYKKSDFPQLEMYHRQTFPLDWFDDTYSYVRYRDKGIALGNRVASFPLQDDTTLCPVHCYPNYPSSWILPEDDIIGCGGSDVGCYVFTYYQEFRPRLGKVFGEISYIDNHENFRLLGAVVDGDTIWGSVSPDWAFTGIAAPLGQPLLVSPNPAKDRAWVELPDWGKEGDLQLIGAQGIVAKTIALPGNAATTLPLDLQGLPPGPYVLTLRTAQGQWTGRLVVR